MSIIFEKTINTEDHTDYKFNIEKFDSAFEVVETCNTRKMTSGQFHDMRSKPDYSMGFEGVQNYNEALKYLEYGYKPSVEKMKTILKKSKSGDMHRFRFQTEIVGETPIVPLALKGIPKDMMSLKMMPIENKVIDLYYEPGASCMVNSRDIIKSGQNLLGAIISLEKQGYRFNLYVIDNYTDEDDSDMMIVKVKSSTQPLNLRRISFPLTHPAFFRVIGFDWYSKFPNGTYRVGYGHVFKHEFNFDNGEIDDVITQLFGNNAVYISQEMIRNADNPEEYLKERFNGNSKAR